MLNNVSIMGRLGKDPITQYTGNGNAVLSFSIACDKIVNGTKSTDWFDCVAWKHNAEFIAKYFKKGEPIVICGRLQIKEYTTQSGEKRRSVEILVNNVDFAAVANRSEDPQQQPQTQAAPVAAAATAPIAPNFSDDFDGIDLPFEF